MQDLYRKRTNCRSKEDAMIYAKYEPDYVVLKCDICKEKWYWKGQTDRLIATYFALDNGWKIAKVGRRFEHYCPECYRRVKEETREKEIQRRLR